jgi:hypothetical protein
MYPRYLVVYTLLSYYFYGFARPLCDQGEPCLEYFPAKPPSIGWQWPLVDLLARLVQSQGEYIVTIVECTILNYAGRAPEHRFCRRNHNNFRHHYFYFNHDTLGTLKGKECVRKLASCSDTLCLHGRSSSALVTSFLRVETPQLCNVPRISFVLTCFLVL